MNIFKILLTLPYFLRLLTKSSSMTRKVLKDQDNVEEEYRYKWLQKRSKYLMWLLGIKVIPHNIKNWKSTGCLIVSNHQSNLDPMVLLKINDFMQQAPVAFIAKQELAEHKKFKRFVHLIDVLFLDRSNPRQALEVLNCAKELIKIPRSMVLFPEGHRSHSDEMQEFKPSLLKIAQKAHVSILPCTIINSYKNLKYPKKDRKKFIHVIFHEPIKPQVIMTRDTTMLSNQIQKTIGEPINTYKDMSDKESKKLYKDYKKSKKQKSEH